MRSPELGHFPKGPSPRVWIFSQPNLRNDRKRLFWLWTSDKADEHEPASVWFSAVRSPVLFHHYVHRHFKRSKNRLLSLSKLSSQPLNLHSSSLIKFCSVLCVALLVVTNTLNNCFIAVECSGCWMSRHQPNHFFKLCELNSSTSPPGYSCYSSWYLPLVFLLVKIRRSLKWRRSAEAF